MDHQKPDPDSQTTLLRETSRLCVGDDGSVALNLVQALCHVPVVGDRLALQRADLLQPPSASDIEQCSAILRATKPNTLTVVSYHPGLRGCEQLLRELSVDRTIVGLAGLTQDANVTFVATGGRLRRLHKVSLSSEDQALGVERGNSVALFAADGTGEPQCVRWAVLNCHEYTHVDLLEMLRRERVELLVVVTHNPATRLYWQYALADIHRMFCYVVIANVAELGGSGVFAPLRRLGVEPGAQLSVAGQLFGTKGPAEIDANVSLDICELRRLRAELSTQGFKSEVVKGTRGYRPVIPSQTFMKTHDCAAGEPQTAPVREVHIDFGFERTRVAFAQLHHIGLKAYVETKYRIRKHNDCAEFEEDMRRRLVELEGRCDRFGPARSGAKLDFLTFPEVFVPRSFLPELKEWSDRLGATIVAGIGYPEGGEAENANECVVLRNGVELACYRKVTRSQYDAWRDSKGDRMPMNRGNQLVRFVDPKTGRGFGILICYDFSHGQLLRQLNLEGREVPLDLVLVVAHNPFGELYRACCVADSHRYYQYLMMCNVAQYGGSGVFGPVRTPGARQTLLDCGKGVEALGVEELDLAGLQRARRQTDSDLHKGEFMRRPGIFQQLPEAEP